MVLVELLREKFCVVKVNLDQSPLGFVQRLHAVSHRTRHVVICCHQRQVHWCVLTTGRLHVLCDPCGRPRLLFDHSHPPISFRRRRHVFLPKTLAVLSIFLRQAVVFLLHSASGKGNSQINVVDLRGERGENTRVSDQKLSCSFLQVHQFLFGEERWCFRCPFVKEGDLSQICPARDVRRCLIYLPAGPTWRKEEDSQCDARQEALIKLGLVKLFIVLLSGTAHAEDTKNTRSAQSNECTSKMSTESLNGWTLLCFAGLYGTREADDRHAHRRWSRQVGRIRLLHYAVCVCPRVEPYFSEDRILTLYKNGSP